MYFKRIATVHAFCYLFPFFFSMMKKRNKKNLGYEIKAKNYV